MFSLLLLLQNSPLYPTFRCFHGSCVQACSHTSRWRSVPCCTVEAGQHCLQLVWLSRWALCWVPLLCSLPPASIKYLKVERTVWPSVALEPGMCGTYFTSLVSTWRLPQCLSPVA